MMIQLGNFDEFLSEFKASLSHTNNGEAVIRRINAEGLLQSLADELIDSNQADRICILPDKRLVGKYGADFLLQINDYDIRLDFIEAPTGKPELNLDKLYDFKNMLENNPSTVALIVVWTTDDLQSIPFSTTRIQHIIHYPEQLTQLIQTAKPLAKVLKAIMARQRKSWKTNLEPTRCRATESTDIHKLFRQNIGSAIETQRVRSYRYTERKIAAHRFPVDEEKKVAFSVLHKALNGVNAQALVPQLTRLPR
jgi:hypothetical protein